MLNLSPATFEDFAREAERGNVVPVVRNVLADLQTPVGAFLRIAGDSRYSFMLESVEGGERVARYSFLGKDPEMIVRGRGDTTFVDRGGALETHEGVRATDFLRDYFRSRKLARREGLAPFSGGVVGYLSYNAARWFEPVLDDGDAAEEDAVLMFYRTVLAFDRVRQQILITSIVFTEEAGGDHARLRKLYERAVVETEKIELALQSALPQSAPRPAGEKNPADEPMGRNWTREEFKQAVLRAKEYIVSGECYQVVLSQRFWRTVTAPAVQIYRALRASNPSPYMFYLQLGDAVTLVGASPEMLVRCREQRLDYRPIAGTRKRGLTETEDWMLGEEMRTDEKEVAEHMMLVDLGRNDLGRVSDFGTVEVRELMSIERYSHVQHLVTSLRARLRDGLDRFDALASCFPAGTVTGAPKVRAMQIIRELEPGERGVYAGTVLYADYANNLDSCIAIRTIVVRGNRAEVQAGAGIVADSDPQSEYEETKNKARALFRAMEMAERGV
ncbi:MAG: anthranilate synthase component I family protein [Pyrinomonadaceae bacterium]